METTINAVLQSEYILLMLWHNQGVLQVPIITVGFIFLSPKWVSITLRVKREARRSLETCNDKDDDDDDDEVSVYDLKQGRFIKECGLAGDALLAPDPLCVYVCVCDPRGQSLFECVSVQHQTHYELIKTPPPASIHHVPPLISMFVTVTKQNPEPRCHAIGCDRVK